MPNTRSGHEDRHAIVERLRGLRELMRREQVDGWLAVSADPHLSEYLPERWQLRRWLSGFGGSAGTLLVTADFAGMWVDSRYWVDARACLEGTGIETVEASSSGGAPLIEGVLRHLPAGGTLGVDGHSLGLGLGRALDQALQATGARLRTDLDLPGELWLDRPGLPAAPVRLRDESFEERRRVEKISLIRHHLRQSQTQWHLVSSLDDIAWLLNLRGADVPFNPVFLAHLLISADRASLFIAPGKLEPAASAALQADGIDVLDYQGIQSALLAIPAGQALLVDPRRTTWSLTHGVGPEVRVVEQINPSTLYKSRKSAHEIAQIRRAMEQDGAALCEFFAWLEAAVSRRERITEITIDEEVTLRRSRRPGYVSPSFGTIAAFNDHGAAPHYSATPERHAVICNADGATPGMLLIDSGGQYEGGTTDITRVVRIDSVTGEQRRDFTLVLKGMIALSRLRFPRGTRSPMIDAIARAPIWQAGIDYGHGTGHGVGYFLNVHEGPHAISPLLPPEPVTTLEPGMITSNEPGIYRPGKWGVRIENLLAVVADGTGEFGDFLRFETLTLCPIDVTCIDRALLDDAETGWLNDYHDTVRARLSPLVTGEALAWLLRSTEPMA